MKNNFQQDSYECKEKTVATTGILPPSRFFLLFLLIGLNLVFPERPVFVTGSARAFSPGYAFAGESNSHYSPWQTTVNWWAEVRKYVGTTEYHATPNRNGLQAPNRAHHIRSYFGAHGVRVFERTSQDRPELLRLELATVGSGMECSPVLPASANIKHVENKVEIRRKMILETYHNSKAGLEQKLTVSALPINSNTSHLELTLVVSPATARMVGDSVVLESPSGRKFKFEKLSVLGILDNKIPSRLHCPDKDTVLIRMEATATDYPVTITSMLTTLAEGKLEINQENAHLGYAVSGAGDVNGDGFDDVVVSAHYYDNGEQNEGAIFLYQGYASGISTLPAAIIESNRENAFLGISVAGAGDVNNDGFADVIAGAWRYADGETPGGVALVYHGSLEGLSSTPATILESNLKDANFAVSVSSAGDVNGDGFADVIIGADSHSKGQSNEGAAFIYHGGPDGISSDPANILRSGQENARFGVSVSTAGDVNKDGYSDVIIGAWLYDKGELDEGAAFIYHGGPNGISDHPAKILESNQESAHLGAGVSTAGDVNNDGYADIIVGAERYDNGEEDEGAVFIYHGGPDGVSDIPATTMESNLKNAWFGNRVSNAGDVNGDGFSDVIVGAHGYASYRYDENANFYYKEPGEGAVFIFHGGVEGVSSTPALRMESNRASSWYGHSVSSAGDINGDGLSDIIVGAYGYDNYESDEGTAFIYYGGSSGISAPVLATVESNQPFSQLGVSVSGAGDVNGDGFDDVIVGADRFDNGEFDEGAAFIFHGSASGLLKSASTILESNQVKARLGNSVSGAGDVNGDGYSDVIVGAPQYTNGQTNEGAAYIFHGSPTGISKTPMAMIESDRESAYLGGSVSGAGDVNSDGFADVIIGAHGYGENSREDGAALVFHGSESGIVPRGTPANADALIVSPRPGARLGYSVSHAGDINGDGFDDIVIGAPYFGNGQKREGAVFIFYGSASGITPTGGSAKADSILESGQENAYFGCAVSAAGDVNKDGYADLIVGAEGFDNGEQDEGAAFVFHGSPSGVLALPVSRIESNKASAFLGTGVSSAGDINGDGYNDIIIGADWYSHGEDHEGVALVFHGSQSGIVSRGNPGNAATVLESNRSLAYFGCSVSGAGDINGDGYSDIIMGARGYMNSLFEEGGAFLYLGSKSGISAVVSTGVDSSVGETKNAK